MSTNHLSDLARRVRRVIDEQHDVLTQEGLAELEAIEADIKRQIDQERALSPGEVRMFLTRLVVKLLDHLGPLFLDHLD